MGGVSTSADRSHDLRDDYWRAVGQLGSHLDPVSDASEPVLWPGGSPEYLQVLTEHTGIISTDGLSDPAEQGSATGHGVELYIEGRELRDISDAAAGWLRAALEEAAGAVAGAGESLAQARQQHGVVSIEVSGGGAPQDWVSGGRLGLLVGVPLPGRPDRATLDGGEVEMLTVVPLRPSELAVITSEGPSGRARVIEALAGAGWHSYAEAARPAVL